MSGFAPLNQTELQAIGQKLEGLAKSFSAGYPGLQNAGRTQTSALAHDNLEPIMRSITLEEEDFLLLKEIDQVPAKGTVYNYVVKNQVRSGNDLWGLENFLPQEDHAQYMRVAELLKIQGIRKSITHLAQLTNEIGGYMTDLEGENDINASLAMSESLERTLYNGGDFYFNTVGEIDATLAANPNGPIRQPRGMQAQIREGNYSRRGFSLDFVGYGNNQLTLLDAKGGTMTRELVDQIATRVRNNRGRLEEAHCTTNQLQAFRTTLFPFERADMSTWYNVKGAGVDIEPKDGFPLMTVTGNIQFRPSVFKFNRQFPEPIAGTVGQSPSTPTAPTPTQNPGKTSYKAGDVVKYVVQAWNVHGASSGSAELAVTIAVDGNSVSLAIPTVLGIEEYWVFRTEANGESGSAKFVGRVIADRSGADTIFVDKEVIMPGLDNIIFLPRKQNRAKLAVLGNLLTKMQLGRLGLVTETIFVSYLANIVEYPRHFGLIDNIYQELDQFSTP